MELRTIISFPSPIEEMNTKEFLPVPKAATFLGLLLHFISAPQLVLFILCWRPQSVGSMYWSISGRFLSVSDAGRYSRKSLVTMVSKGTWQRTRGGRKRRRNSSWRISNTNKMCVFSASLLTGLVFISTQDNVPFFSSPKRGKSNVLSGTKKKKRVLGSSAFPYFRSLRSL